MPFRDLRNRVDERNRDLYEAASAADATACSKATVWQVPDFPDRQGLRKDLSCATMKPS